MALLVAISPIFANEKPLLSPTMNLGDTPGVYSGLREDILLDEGFEGTLVGWSQINNNGDGVNWGIYTEDAEYDIGHTGSKGAGIQFSVSGNDDYFLTPSIVLPSNQTITFSFWSRSNSASYLESFNVKLATSGTDVGDFSNLLGSVTAASAVWTQYSYDISSFGGQTVTIAIQNISVDMWYQWVDDVLVVAEVTGTGPVADFIAAPLSGEAPLLVQFSDQSTGSPTSWAWNFGDGGTSNAQNPSHTFNSSGSFSVSLTASNGNGSDTHISPNLVSVTDPITPGDIDLTYWGLKYSSQVNQSIRVSKIKVLQFCLQNNKIFHAYKTGNGSSSADRPIIVNSSADNGYSWDVNNLTPANAIDTEDPIITSSGNDIVVMFNYTNSSGEVMAHIARSADGGNSYDTLSINNSYLEGCVRYPRKIMCLENGTILIARSTDLFISTDSGNSFVEIPTPAGVGTFNFTATNDYIWISSPSTTQITTYRSPDYGDTWEIIDSQQAESHVDKTAILADGSTTVLAWSEQSLLTNYIYFKFIDGPVSDQIFQVDTDSLIGYPYQNFWPLKLHKTSTNFWITTDKGRYVYKASLTGSDWSNAADMYLEANFEDYPSWFTMEDNILFKDDNTIYALGCSMLDPAPDAIFNNLRWIDIPYSSSYLDTVVEVDNLAIEWESYVLTGFYKFQLSDDNFANILLDTTLNGPSISLALWPEYPTNSIYYYRLCGYDPYDEYQTNWTPTISFQYNSTTGTSNVVNLPSKYFLAQNYPNPFNPSTTIKYGIPESANVSIVVYDIRGTIVTTINSGKKQAGWYEHTWNGRDDSGQPVSTGLYFTHLQAGSYSKAIKMLYLK